MSATDEWGRYYDPDGNELASMDEWYPYLGDDKWRRVTTLGEGDHEVTISTVYLGLNHRFGEGPPLIFETKIFGGEYDQKMWRWSSKSQAAQMHAKISLALEKKQPVSQIPWD